ncbi:LrgB family protein [Bacillus luteolus]|uniref:LrgB family protein n=1 Tax=Litchfieldia luteola TaxID=682179 RepID=A0ABR9QIJ9_9BACI|nr:LrgB family protein [Cytobacillus luteolus]MBE4908323.1 LrgB family protein [Cytobacillus luteolus]MBP1943111.1 putative murein hydrolase (TIGR00659 family) [Cytobacillus luteolus]
MNIAQAVCMIILTLILYSGMKVLYQKKPSPILVPIATTTLALILLLSLFNYSYEEYMTGGKWIDELLGPAVVALAFPLYQNRKLLKKYYIPIVAGVLSGSFISLLTGICMSIFIGLDKEIMLSILPKSVTSPVAMDIAGEIGGAPSLAAVYVMIAGIGGAVFGPSLLKRCGVTHYIGIGMGFGAAAHGIGTAKALEIGEREGAISSVSMILSAIFAAIFLPYVTLLL